jgi:DNA-binding NtrC family response regulator
MTREPTNTEQQRGADYYRALVIFEPFFTTTERGKGMGLGVATVYGTESGGSIAADHCGDVQLLFTDVVLTGMTGRDLAGRLVAAGRCPSVLYTSGYPDDRSADDGILGPRAAFLQKPFAPNALLRTVRDFLDRREPLHAELVTTVVANG